MFTLVLDIRSYLLKISLIINERLKIVLIEELVYFKTTYSSIYRYYCTSNLLSNISLYIRNIFTRLERSKKFLVKDS